MTNTKPIPVAPHWSNSDVKPVASAEYAIFCWKMIDLKIVAMGRLAVLRWAAQKRIEEAVEFNKLLMMQEYHGMDYDQQDLHLEQGDGLFYDAVIACALGVPEAVLRGMNIKKLDGRGDYAAYLADRGAPDD